MTLIADQPRTYKEGDPQYIKVQALKTFLEREEHEHFLSCNNLIALYGEWGSCLLYTSRTFLPLIIQVDKVPSSIDGVAIDITVKWLLIGLSFFLVTAASVSYTHLYSYYIHSKWFHSNWKWKMFYKQN